MASYNLMPLEILEDRASAALSHLEACGICPRRCGNNRLADERSFCRCGQRARVASLAPHLGEEAHLVDRNGSETIFFCGCNLSCI